MNNMDDLRGVLRSLESEAPDPDAVRRRLYAAESLRHGRSRQMRRFALPAVAAAAVIAGAITLSVVESGPSGNLNGVADSPRSAATGPTGSAPTSPAPASTEPPGPGLVRPTPVALTWTFAVAPVKGYTIVREQIAAGYQTARITVSGSVKDIGGLTVYPPAEQTPSDVRRALAGKAVTVRGATGFFRIVARKAYLAWHTADGGWAVIEGDWTADVAQQQEESIADATDTSARDPLTIDFGVGYLPATLSIAGTNFYADYGGKPHMELDLVDEVPGQVISAGEHTPAVLIQRDAPTEDNGQPGTDTFHANTTINGRPAEYDDAKPYRDVLIKFPGNTILSIIVDKTHYARYDKSALLKIARSITPVGDPAIPSTWKPAQPLLPR